MMKMAEVAQSSLVKLREDSTISQMLDRISKCGTTVIVGGAVRDWYLSKAPRDIDIIVDCSDSQLENVLRQSKKNKFGGFKLTLNKVEFDIWSLCSTWAFNNDSKFAKNMETVPETVFLNLDAITFCPSTGVVLDKGFTQAIESRMLDTVYQPNPYPYFCVSKALTALVKYDLYASDNLKKFIRGQEDRGYSEACFNRYQKVSYGDVVFSYKDCLGRLNETHVFTV